MTNSQDRKWVESGLRFWQAHKPTKHISAARIAWEIEQFTKMLERLPQ